VRLVAGDAAFAQGLMLKHKRPALFGVALEAGLILAHYICSAASFDDRPLVRVVAIRATHFAFQHRMMMRQAELGPYFQVALETGLWRFVRVDDGVGRAAAGDVLAARPVARFAPDVLCILAVGHEARVIGRFKVLGDRFMAIRASLGPDESRPRDGRRRQNCAGRAARDHCHRECGATSGDP